MGVWKEIQALGVEVTSWETRNGDVVRVQADNFGIVSNMKREYRALLQGIKICLPYNFKAFDI